LQIVCFINQISIMQVNEHIAAIIGKKLEGQATTEELEQLQLWLDSGAGGAQEYDQLARIWAESPRVLAPAAFDTATAWIKVDATIQALPRKAAVRSLQTYRRMAVAAAVILLAGAGWLLYNNTTRWQTVEALAANQSLSLPDGSIVELRKGSKLEYPAGFTGTERRVRLTGEAFFSVQPNKHQPFRINTPRSQVEVLGTSFLVRSEATLDEVVVAAGSVSVTDKAQSSNRIVLVAGQKAVLEQERFSQDKVTDSNYLAWKTGFLEFKATPLNKALDDLSHYYNISVSLAKGQDAASKTSLTVRFENEPFESVLEELKQVTGLEAKKENGKIFLYQK
jgi:ferric-dicitrate binding protein FerR (iron transport regulator)